MKTPFLNDTESMNGQFSLPFVRIFSRSFFLFYEDEKLTGNYKFKILAQN